MRLQEALTDMPVVAILRGIQPQEIEPVVDALYSAGIRIVEVPMNSPDPLKSVAVLARIYAARLLVGAGTVVKSEWVDEIYSAGGKLVVAPNTDPAVIKRSLECGLEPIPGFATATEGLTACKAGARYLKLFPASSLGPSSVRALKTILPTHAAVLAVGGVTRATLQDWWDAGVEGFGIGSEIYRPGRSADEIFHLATELAAAINKLTTQKK